jgi:hypothetical protein
LPSGNQVTSFTATATQYLAVTASCSTRTLQCVEVELHVTPVTAVHWVTHALANQAGLALFGGSIAAFGPHVWLAELTGNGVAQIDVSSNDGATFALHAEPRLSGPGPCSLTATSPSTLWTACPTGSLVQFDRSTDAGVAWSAVALPRTAGTRAYAFDPLAADLGLYASGGGLYRSTGAGPAVRRGGFPATGVRALVFTSPTHGLAIGLDLATGATSLFASVNGGTSWRRVP